MTIQTADALMKVFGLKRISEVTIGLPWPPSTNHMYRSIGRGRVIMSTDGRKYVDAVAKCIMALRAQGLAMAFGKSRLSVEVNAFVPDKRRRDLGNLEKACFDSLTKCGVWEDDCQIDFFSFRRREMVKGGSLRLTIKELP